MIEDRLEDAEAKVAQLEGENRNLRQELHEPDSPEGKAYQSEVGRLTEDLAGIRAERESLFDQVEEMCAGSLKWARRLEEQKVELQIVKARAGRAVKFARDHNCGRSDCPSVSCRESRALGEEWEKVSGGLVGAAPLKAILGQDVVVVVNDPAVPPGEVWLKNGKGEVLGKIINVGVSDAPEEKSG